MFTDVSVGAFVGNHICCAANQQRCGDVAEPGLVENGDDGVGLHGHFLLLPAVTKTQINEVPPDDVGVGPQKLLLLPCSSLSPSHHSVPALLLVSCNTDLSKAHFPSTG